MSWNRSWIPNYVRDTFIDVNGSLWSNCWEVNIISNPSSHQRSICYKQFSSHDVDISLYCGRRYFPCSLTSQYCKFQQFCVIPALRGKIQFQQETQSCPNKEPRVLLNQVMSLSLLKFATDNIILRNTAKCIANSYNVSVDFAPCYSAAGIRFWKWLA